MQISAEIRWFWHATPPTGLEAWFHNPSGRACPAGGGGVRIDAYLSDPGQAELGVKLRGGKSGVEVKGLVALAEHPLNAGPFAGPVEIWAKWTSQALAIDSGTAIHLHKRRWVRKFDTTADAVVEVPLNDREQPTDASISWPARGCNVELTEVTLAHGDPWWTLGFEAFGSLATVADDLQQAATMLAEGATFDLSAGVQASYPAWLRGWAGRASAPPSAET